MSPTISTCGGGNTEPKIMTRTAYDRNFGSKGKLQDIDGATQTLQAGMGEGGATFRSFQSKQQTRKATTWQLTATA